MHNCCTQCKHDEVRYCPDCKKVYCLKCKKEWGNYTYTTPYCSFVTIPSGTIWNPDWTPDWNPDWTPYYPTLYHTIPSCTATGTCAHEV